MNSFKGRDGLIFLVCLYRAERLHHRLVSSFVLALMCCLVTDKLLGRLPLRSVGRVLALLEPNSVAALASSSAASLPVDFMWPATQVSVIEMGVLINRLFRFPSCPLSTKSLIAVFILSMMYWPDWARLLPIDLMAAWLSMLMLMFGCVSMCSLAR